MTPPLDGPPCPSLWNAITAVIQMVGGRCCWVATRWPVTLENESLIVNMQMSARGMKHMSAVLMTRVRGNKWRDHFRLTALPAEAPAPATQSIFISQQYSNFMATFSLSKRKISNWLGYFFFVVVRFDKEVITSFVEIGIIMVIKLESGGDNATARGAGSATEFQSNHSNSFRLWKQK